MSIADISRSFNSQSSVDDLNKTLRDNKIKRVSIKGLAGSAPAFLFSAIKVAKHPLLIIADDLDAAGYLYHDLCQILQNDTETLLLPSAYRRNIRYGQIDAPNQILRTEALNGWNSKSTRFIITYPDALAENVPAPKKLSDNTISISRTGRTTMSEVVKRLREIGFRETDYVYEPGQFARRGSILDVYSYANFLPYRIDFFDDEIDSIRIFNVETQLSQEKTDEISIISAEACNSTDTETISILKFIPENTIILCQNFENTITKVRNIATSSLSLSAVIAGDADTDAMNNVVDADDFESEFRKFKIVEYEAATIADADATITFNTAPQALYHKNFNLIAESFNRLIDDGYKLFILSDSKHQTERLATIFADRNDTNIRFTPIQSTVHQGFIDHASKSCFFTDHQIFDRFHKYNLKSEYARSGKLALSIKELNQIEVGDYIVHFDHGVGRFGGLVKTDVNSHTQEMIKLIYANDDIIFVSIHALHKLSKYRGKEGVPPKINKLGTGAWNRIKDRTKSKMKEIARDLIALYAARKDAEGFAFSPDSYLQHELEASFIYEDTPDQLTTTAAVKKDMEAARPMDRLVCGDVGFGKTEIAIRAAFKAATDSKQTAVLVPTTVLALQHFNTFSRRLKDLPVRVDFISRARKPKEVKMILEDLKNGKIDILIGTHKIVGKDVQFKDLGLLIVDEEQKFGVAVKEKLKQMKVNVDTLTMSATPIPRTLQFSLMGARDLSTLNTPPANRHPIETNVAVDNDEIISEAINFELSRNGQIFFVCNRIEHLATLENKIRRLVPDIRLVTAHGQMPPEKLEKAIVDFINHDFDLLLSTTIIESGIDMPNVNTIIIHNAQNFGLSELHQLRGRVGRSSRKAFCHLLIPGHNAISPIARRRLHAIESFTDLGSGIHIAMQDLDIRGAGNLLGAEQSGFIADLGYETYQKILKEAVIELKTEEFADTFADAHDDRHKEFVADCIIESDMELRIPAEYVPQEGERIALYQELDNMNSANQTDEFRNRLKDRFGNIPYVTQQLISIVPLRAIAKQLGIERLNLKQSAMYLFFVDSSNQAYYNSAAFGRVLQYLQIDPRRCKIRDIKGKRSIVIDNVTTVDDALHIMNTIRSLPSA